jgi:hypothetical protein
VLSSRGNLVSCISIDRQIQASSMILYYLTMKLFLIRKEPTLAPYVSQVGHEGSTNTNDSLRGVAISLIVRTNDQKCCLSL